MDIRTFDDLLLYMKRRRVLGYRPPVLLLGAGASFEAGIGTMTQLFQFTKGSWALLVTCVHRSPRLSSSAIL